MDVQKNNPPPNAKTSERLATSHLCKKGKDVNYAAIKKKNKRDKYLGPQRIILARLALFSLSLTWQGVYKPRCLLFNSIIL